MVEARRVELRIFGCRPNVFPLALCPQTWGVRRGSNSLKRVPQTRAAPFGFSLHRNAQGALPLSYNRIPPRRGSWPDSNRRPPCYLEPDTGVKPVACDLQGRTALRSLRQTVELMSGIEPESHAYHACALPLSYKSPSKVQILSPRLFRVAGHPQHSAAGMDRQRPRNPKQVHSGFLWRAVALRVIALLASRN